MEVESIAATQVCLALLTLSFRIGHTYVRNRDICGTALSRAVIFYTKGIRNVRVSHGAADSGNSQRCCRYTK